MMELTREEPRIRSLELGDRAAYLTAVDRLSPESFQTRFLTPRHQLSDRDVARTFDIGHDLRDAVVAVDPATGDILGVARMAPTEDGASTVEVAITVGDAFQGRGLGTRLLAELLRRAAALGATGATATTSVSNSPVHHLLRRAGFVSVRRSLGVQDWRLEALPS